MAADIRKHRLLVTWNAKQNITRIMAFVQCRTLFIYKLLDILDNLRDEEFT